MWSGITMHMVAARRAACSSGSRVTTVKLRASRKVLPFYGPDSRPAPRWCLGWRRVPYVRASTPALAQAPALRNGRVVAPQDAASTSNCSLDGRGDYSTCRSRRRPQRFDDPAGLPGVRSTPCVVRTSSVRRRTLRPRPPAPAVGLRNSTSAQAVAAFMALDRRLRANIPT